MRRRALMAVLLGNIALVNLYARSGGSCGGFGPLLGAVEGILHNGAVLAMEPCACSRRKPHRGTDHDGCL